jgi:hypothetical protein
MQFLESIQEILAERKSSSQEWLVREGSLFRCCGDLQVPGKGKMLLWGNSSFRAEKAQKTSPGIEKRNRIPSTNSG